MKTKIFHIFDAINREGLGSDRWGLCNDVEAEYYFGTDERLFLEGEYAYIYNQDFIITNEKFEEVEPDYVLASLDLDNVYLYKL